MAKKDISGEKWISGKINFGLNTVPNYTLMGAGYAGSTGAASKWLESNKNEHFMDFRLKNNYPAATVRGLYLRVRSYGAASTGEALRAYYESYGTQTSSHGAHITNSVQKTGAAITGEAIGLRATLDTGTSLTLTGGTYAALRVDTNLNSALSGVTLSAMMLFSELQSSKVTNFIATLGTGAGFAANTHSIDSHALAMIATCNINGTTCYLPFFAAVPA